MKYLLFFFAFGCAYISEANEAQRLDPDGDGVLWPDDCDDQDQSIGLLTWYVDQDGDGYGDDATQVVRCVAPETEMILQGGDCDDANTAIFPAAEEICDGIDNNCNQLVDDQDETLSFVGAVVFYRDGDGDGFGDARITLQSCEAPEGYVGNDQDCNDESSLIHPNATEECDDLDNNCDGQADEGLGDFVYRDGDGDGFGDPNDSIAGCEIVDGYVDNDQDCDDTNAELSPASDEICDGIDNNCNELIDNDDDTLVDGNLYYRDADADGFGDLQNTRNACSRPSGYQSNSSDCDDNDAKTYPGAATLESITACMTDSDLDGFGSLTPAVGVEVGSDCDDNDLQIHPNAVEQPVDGIDQNCDFMEICYADLDADGFGSPMLLTSSSISCSAYGVAISATDCDDSDSATYPGAAPNDSADACMTDADGDGYGDLAGSSDAQAGSDCDDGDSATYPGVALNDSSTDCMTDADGDGYGDANATAGIIAGSDCDDADSSIRPSATEVIADGIDQDCNSTELCYFDADNDGYGTNSTIISLNLSCDGADESTVTTDCDDGDSATYPGAAFNESLTDCMTDVDTDGYGGNVVAVGVTNGSDCDDASAAIHPAATELMADGVDQDCDTYELCYLDADGDGYGGSNTIVSTDMSCNQSAESDLANDCDDNSANTYPGAALNDSITACMADVDGDDYGDANAAAGVTAGSDCDDSDSSIRPSATEVVADGVDQDCNSTELCYFDADNDGYGTSNTIISLNLSCNDADESTVTTDCDDGASATYPGAAENESNPILCMTDVDGDGYGAQSVANGVIAGSDCDDTANTIHSAASEIPGDGIDQNCDNQEDCYVDDDSDGYGTNSVISVASLSCNGISFSAVNGDCDDSDPLTYPGAAPNDSPTDCMTDADGDDYGDAASANATVMGSDCDDSDSYTYPGAAPEDSSTDCMTDADGDGYGDDGAASPIVLGSDCDDSDDMSHPWGQEWSGSIDNNCDGLEQFGITECWGRWNNADTHYFLLCGGTTAYDWEDGNNVCKDAGYDGLASLSTNDHSVFFKQNIWFNLNTSEQPDSFWIGLTSTAAGGFGDYQWVDGSSYTYAEWTNNQPAGDQQATTWCTSVTKWLWQYSYWSISDCAEQKNISCSYQP